MKRLLIILLILLTACSPTFSDLLATPALPQALETQAVAPTLAPTLAPDVCSYLATQMAQCNLAPVTITPVPTISPTPTPSVVFNPYDGTYDPALGIYEVGPLTENSFEKLSDYTNAGNPNNFFPATYWAEYWAGGAAVSFTYCPNNIMNVGLEENRFRMGNRLFGKRL